MNPPDAEVIETPQLEQALSQLGHVRFRPGQREAVQTLLEAGHLLLVAPTGGGKSLTYQLPALLLPGTTLVVSPLISLMHDQVEALREQGVSSTYLASTLDSAELRARAEGLTEGQYQIAYVAPERLSSPDFLAVLQKLDCPLVAIDEAHCISEWGHDFRPDYLQIGDTLARLPGTRILACTATATPIVRDEIVARLGLPPDTPQIVRGFARPNLALRAEEVPDKRNRSRAVDEVLSEALGLPGDQRGAAIVYAPTRKTTEEEARRLSGDGWTVGTYHAGLEADARASTHDQFSRGQLEVVVATNAFGMGIDRADVRAVIHLAPPGS
ncbi:RecQ family ATP-dependent DNA helicase, partial [Myxococcota bacterium]|nr:RecQ family ATP-dependent DNA helicase [Myxococcota bacterium]